MLQIDTSISQPLYIQLYKQLKSDIIKGLLPAYNKLPSKRKLASQLSISVNTVELAYNQLISEGFIYFKPILGYFVCEIGQLLPISSNMTHSFDSTQKKQLPVFIDFSLNGVDSSAFPYILWKKLFRNIFDASNTILEPSPIEGELTLREAISTHIYITRGVISSPSQIIVGAGTEHLLQILHQLLSKDCMIAMENPVYNESYAVFQQLNRRVLSIAIDEQGIQLEPLQNISSVAVYVTPSHQFPLGVAMPISRRISILNWANEHSDRYIIEDDYDSQFKYDTKPIPSLKSSDMMGKVIYLGSFSRSIAPCFRISYMVLPPKLLSVYHKQYKTFTCAVSKTEQLILADFIKNGNYETHLNRMRKIYREKREFLKQQLKNAFCHDITIYGENAGQHILLKIHKGFSEEELCKKAYEKGVQVYPLSPYFSGVMPQQYHCMILLGYAPLSLEQLQKGVSLLKSAWA